MAQINLRVADDVKLNAEKVCADMGLSMSAAINIFLIKLGKERRIPFEITADPDPFYTDEHITMLEKRIADIKAGKNMNEHELVEVN